MTAALDPKFERVIEDLVLIADWRDDLVTRIRRAELLFELVDIDHPEIDAVFYEVHDFKRVCRVLGRSIRMAA
jgi:hypothetical protein